MQLLSSFTQYYQHVIDSACLAEDCFELGRLSYNSEDHYHTIMWMEEALMKNEVEEPSVDTASILDYLAFSTYMVIPFTCCEVSGIA